MEAGRRRSRVHHHGEGPRSAHVMDAPLVCLGRPLAEHDDHESSVVESVVEATPVVEVEAPIGGHMGVYGRGCCRGCACCADRSAAGGCRGRPCIRGARLAPKIPAAREPAAAQGRIPRLRPYFQYVSGALLDWCSGGKTAIRRAILANDPRTGSSHSPKVRADAVRLPRIRSCPCRGAELTPVVARARRSPGGTGTAREAARRLGPARRMKDAGRAAPLECRPTGVRTTGTRPQRVRAVRRSHTPGTAADRRCTA